MKKTVTVQPEEEGLRLDTCLARKGFSRSEVQKMIKHQKVTLLSPILKGASREKTLKPSYKVQARDRFEVTPFPKEEQVLKPYNCPVPVVFEDEHLLVVNKPAGLVTHPAQGHLQDTLVNALLRHTSLSEGTHPLRPGIVHRLDQYVSGLMVLSKTIKARDLLVQNFRFKKIKRLYRAVGVGTLTTLPCRVESFIGRHPKDRKKFCSFSAPRPGARPAVTLFRVVKSFKEKAHWVECQLQTGRTHQIRLHLAGLGLPVLGETVYARAKAFRGLKEGIFMNPLPRLALYSAVMEFSHPVTGRFHRFELPWPADLKAVLTAFDFF